MTSSLLRPLPFALLALAGTAGFIACETSTDAPPSPDSGVSLEAGDFDSNMQNEVPCADTTGTTPVAHGNDVVTDETWGAGLHDVTFDIGVRKGATLTLAPCAVVRVIKDRGIAIGTSIEGDGGKLVAVGTAVRPIVITTATPGERWNHVLVNSLGTADLAYVALVGGGGTYSRGGGALHLYGDQYKPIQALAKVVHVTISGAGKYGAVLEGRGAFSADSSELAVSGAGDMALKVNGPAIGTVPTGLYTGNTIDAIRLMGSGSYDIIDADVTIHDRGVPYVVGGDGAFNEMSVQGPDGTQPLLTIEPGVTLKFGKATSGLFIDRAMTTVAARGALSAIGTNAKPITFTSNEALPAAGDWTGIHFRGVPSAKNKIDYARVEYAGADTGTTGFSCGTPPSSNQLSNEAAIAIFGQPSSAFVTNTVISKSAANGFERAWTGTEVDFTPTNTFTDVAYCTQTQPKPAVGSCPATPSCPK